MKNLFYAIFVLSTISCSKYFHNPVHTYKDEVKKKTVYTLSQNIVSKDRPFVYCNVQYQRIVSNTGENLDIYLSLQREVNAVFLRPEGFLQIEDSFFALNFEKLDSKIVEESSTSVTQTRNDSVSTSTSSTSSTSQLLDKIKISLNSTQMQAMANNDTIAFHLYAGAVPLIFPLRKSHIEEIQELISKK